jgi:hypothetical protein
LSIHKRVQGLHVIYTELIKVNKLGITKISSRSQDNKSNGNHYPRYNTEIVADDGSSTRKLAYLVVMMAGAQASNLHK